MGTEFTTESTTDFTTPTLESTILASVKPELTLNSYTTPMLDTHTPLDIPDILDTPDTLDTPPHTPTATCGTDTTTKNQDFKLTFYQVPDFTFFIFASFPSATTEIWQIAKF